MKGHVAKSNEALTSDIASLLVARKPAVDRYKLRMLLWSNPVEYVNNMYGSHPDEDDDEYFDTVYCGD